MLRDVRFLDRPARLWAGVAAAALLLGVAACAGGNGGKVTLLPSGGAGQRLGPSFGERPDAKHTGVAAFTITVPSHTSTNPAYTAPGTRGIAIRSRRAGSAAAHSAFFALTTKEHYCAKGAHGIVLNCVLNVAVTTGAERFEVDAFDSESTSGKLLASTSAQQTIHHGSNAVPLSWSPSDATPTPSPVPTNTPSPVPSASPSPTPTPPGQAMTAVPASVSICPSTGSARCENDAARTTITQGGSAGTFAMSTTCASSVATVALNATSGDTATYTITGGSAAGTCTATFAGDGGVQVSVAITVTPGGIGINTTTRNHLR